MNTRKIWQFGLCAGLLLLLLAPGEGICAKAKEDYSEEYPKASPDATDVIVLQSNKEGTEFFVDGVFVVRASRAKILVNKKAHTIVARVPGYKTKEIYIQPPYKNQPIFGVTFLNEDRTDDKDAEPIAPPDDQEPPVLNIYQPDLSKRDLVIKPMEQTRLEIRGQAWDKSGIAYVKVNGEKISVASDGSFNYLAYLKSGENFFLVEAVDSVGNRAVKEFKVQGGGAEPSRSTGLGSLPLAEFKTKPALWLLSIGVSKYQTPGQNLAYADNDAIMFAQFFERQKGQLFSEVFVKTLVNEQATRENIMMSMTQHLGKASPNDLVIIFIAGHGIKSQQTGSYYFLTYDTDATNLISRGFKWSDFDEAVKILSQNVNKVVLILDTCHSGAMQVSMRSIGTGEDLVQALKDASGLYTLAASKSGESSLESKEYKIKPGDSGHGAFTYALLKGLEGEANYDQDQYLSLSELFNYVSKTVPRLTNGSQHPYFRIEGTDLPIAKMPTKK